jgi:hypothetical protein
MAGSSIAAPGAIAWVTDFLNAAYYARAEEERDVEDLRVAHGIITTRWARHKRGRLGALDVLALNRAYGMLRLRRRGRLDGETLRHGARRLIGEWFPEAWDDDERRAYGIAFRSVDERRAFSPERRLERAALKPLTPPLRAPADQRWATYDPVRLPKPDGALALVVLTTHEGHFLGRALSQLLVWRDSDGAWIRDVGAWDPLPPHLAAAYRSAGREAQQQFWGPAPEERSMLAQLARVTG